MRLTLNIHHFIAGQFARPRLQEFLQARLRVLAGVDQRQAVEFVGQPRQYAIARRFHARIQIDGANQGFQGVGQDRFAAETATLQFARTQAQVFAQVKTACQHGQGFTLHQARTQARQLAFARLRETFEQRLAGDEVENGITEELQTLVIAPGETAVGQGQDHQFLVLEGIAELTLETAQGNAHNVPTRISWSNFTTGPMNRGSHFWTFKATGTEVPATVTLNALFKSGS
ncbi:hypothetical protein D9M71_138090 [compost metagenome]